jgi:thymidylate kinase
MVGAEGSGKSSLIAAVSGWLSKNYAVKTIHAGKPPPTWLSFLPRLFLPLFRQLFRSSRVNVVELELNRPGEKYSLEGRKVSFLYLVRSALVAYDQYRELKRGYRLAKSGWIVISDRWPSAVLGGMDGPRVSPEMVDGVFKKILAKFEISCYQAIPLPDAVLRLEVPLEIAVARNAARSKKEPETSVRKRHALMEKWKLPGATIYRIVNDQALSIMEPQVKELFWKIIQRN